MRAMGVPSTCIPGSPDSRRWAGPRRVLIDAATMRQSIHPAEGRRQCDSNTRSSGTRGGAAFESEAGRAQGHGLRFTARYRQMKSQETTPDRPTRAATWTIGNETKVRQVREGDRYSVLPKGVRQDDWTRAVAPLAAAERFADHLERRTRNDPLARIRYVLASRCAGMTLQATAEQAVRGIIEADAPEECAEAARQFTTHADGNDLLQGSIDGAYTLRALASYLHRTGEARKTTRRNWVLNLSEGVGLGTARTPDAP